MPRQPRMDAPGALHHVMGRGIERTRVFQNDFDRADFVERLAQRARAGDWAVYAWALMPNHFHLLVRTGKRPLAQTAYSGPSQPPVPVHAGRPFRGMPATRSGPSRPPDGAKNDAG